MVDSIGIFEQAKPFYEMAERPRGQLLYYTCVNEKYYEFAVLFPLFAALSSRSAIIEVGIDNPIVFMRKYWRMILFYRNYFSNRIIFTHTPFGRCMPNSVRFLTQPYSIAKYIYITDADILILEDDIIDKHVKNIFKNSLDYSNIVRSSDNERLTGLHFIEYNKMFPVDLNKFRDIDPVHDNDEKLLYKLMKLRGFKTPDNDFRPVHGLHASFYSRPPLPTLTTLDSMVDFPSWLEPDRYHEVARRYSRIRYSVVAKKFMANIDPVDVSLRRIVQFIDLFCYYIMHAFSCMKSDHAESSGSVYNDFTKIYQNNGFLGDESISGPGSSMSATALVRQALSGVFHKYGILSLFDVPCGDFNWMSSVNLENINYSGGDIVHDLIAENQMKYGDRYSFKVFDLRKDQLPEVDLLFCRDCFIHLPYRDIIKCIDNIKQSKITWLLVSTYYMHNNNELAGLWRPVNLEDAPFSFPPPVELINERVYSEADSYRDKALGLWKLDDIRALK